MIPFFAQAFDSKQAGEYVQVFNAYEKKKHANEWASERAPWWWRVNKNEAKKCNTRERATEKNEEKKQVCARKQESNMPAFYNKKFTIARQRQLLSHAN